MPAGTHQEFDPIAKVLWYWPAAHATPNPVARELVARGYDLTVQAQRSFGGVRSPVEGFGYRVLRDLPELGRVFGHKINNGPHRQLQILQRHGKKLLRALTSSPDIVEFHTLDYRVDWFALRLIRLGSRARLVGLVHDVRPHVSQLPSWLEDRLLRYLYQSACLDHLIVYHDALKDELTSGFGVDPKRVTVLPHPIWGGEIQVLPRERARINVLFMGTLRDNKGVEVLVKAIECAPVIDNLQFTIAGRGSRNLELLVRDLAAHRQDVTAEIGRFSGTRKRELLLDADLVVLPYTSFHSQSGVLADSYAYGVPLVVTDVGAIGPTVRSDNSGWVVPPNRPAELREAIGLVLAAPEEYRAKVAGVGQAAARHSPERVVDGLEVAYGIKKPDD